MKIKLPLQAIAHYFIVTSLLLALSLTSVQAQYCVTNLYTSGCSVGDDIGVVQFNTINNVTTSCTSGNTGYNDFTSISTTVKPGLTYSLTVGTSSTVYSQGFGAWIDFNQDGDFMDVGEFIYNSPTYASAPTTFTGSVTIPPNALAGPTRLRVRGVYSDTVGAAEACMQFTYGEIEDYTVNIQSSGPNDAGVIAIDSPAAFCVGTHNIVATIQNFGNNVINSLTVNWTFDGVAQTPVAYASVLDTIGGSGNNTAQVVLGSKSFASGVQHTIKAWTSGPNSVTDTVNLNDTSSKVVQPAISGTFTIGGTSPSYNTFTDAVNDLNNFGVCGPVVFNVRAGTYNEQVHLNNIVGTSAVNTITFQSETGDSSAVTLTYLGVLSSFNYTVKISGSSYISWRKLTISNTGTSYGRVFDIGGGSDYFTIENCVISGPGASTTSNAIANIYNASGNDNHMTLRNSIFKQGSYALFMTGSSSANQESGSVIENNIIEHYYMGIYLYYQQAAIVRGNTITSNTFGTYDYGYGIYGYYCDSNTVITKNKIDQASGRYGMYMSNWNASATSPGLVANNMIHVGGGSTAYGIYTTGSTKYIRFYHNSINISSGSTTAGRGLYISNSTGTGHEIINNVIANTGGGHAYYVNYPLSIAISDYNDIYSTGPSVGYWNGGVSDLASWKAASGKDSNSVSSNPGFYSNSNLHATSGGINDLGTYLSIVPDDIDGEVRSLTTPDMGADEFVPPPNDIGVIGFASPQAFGCDASDSTEVAAILFNFGSAPQTNFQVSYRIYSVIVATETVTDTIHPGDSLIYQFSATVDLSVPGLYPFSAWTILSGDANPYNDSLLIHPVTTDTVMTQFPYLITFENSGGSIPLSWANDPFDGGEDWNFNNTGSPFPSGINADHTTGSGYYAWIDNSFPNSNPTNLLSPCLDLGTMTHPFLEFYYWNTDFNSSVQLYIDVLDGGVWHENIAGPLGFQSMTDWGYHLISLGQFTGSTIKVRFRAQEVGTASSPDVAIDDIKIFNLPAFNTSVISLLNPNSDCGLSDIEMVKVAISQYGYSTFMAGDTIPVAFSVDGVYHGKEYLILADSLEQFATDTFTFSTVADLSVPGNHIIKVWTEVATDDDYTNDTITVIISNTIQDQYPELEEFETFTQGYDATGYENYWSTYPDATTSSYRWNVYSGSSPTGNTGPTGAYSGNIYVYTEASSGSVGAVAELYTPCYDLSGLSQPGLNFMVHMYGTTMGELHLDVLDDTTWHLDVMTPIVGNHGNDWHRVAVKLDNFNNKIISFRFRGIRGSSLYGDMAIDDFVVGELPNVGLGDTLTDCGFTILNAGNPGASYNWSTGSVNQQITLIAHQVATTTQTIHLEVTNQMGLSNADSVVVILSPGPYVNLGNDTLVCGGNIIILDAGNSGMATQWDDFTSAQTRTVTTDGTYYVTVDNGAGCVKSDTIVVDFEDFPVANFTWQQLAGGQTVAFTNTSTGANSILWDLGTGYFTNTPDPTFYYLPGVYDIRLIVTNKCGNDTLTQQITVTPVGLQNQHPEFSVRVYPNPGAGIYHIAFDTELTENVQLEVIGLDGKLLLTEQLDFSTGKKEFTMNLSRYPAGIYYLRLTSGSNYFMHKVLKR